MIIDRFLPNSMGGFFISVKLCSCGGIGIHNRLKICRPYGLASSSLAGSMVTIGGHMKEKEKIELNILKYKIEATSGFNDGWTQQHYKELYEKELEKLDRYNRRNDATT